MRSRTLSLGVVILVTALTSLVALASITASFTATNSGHQEAWKHPATWGQGGKAGGGHWPGYKGRADDATIPTGRTVDYQGGAEKKKATLKMGSLTVNGTLRGNSNKTDIKIETTGNIAVGGSGRVGGSGAGVKQSHEIRLTSTGGTVNVQGRVQSDRKPVKISGQKGVSISGRVEAKGGKATIKSSRGDVSITGGARVLSDGDMTVAAARDSGTVNVDCLLESRRGSVTINSSSKPGVVAVKDTVRAKREVVIHADSLYVEGLIEGGHSVQKHCRVVKLGPKGCVKAGGKEVEKVEQKQEEKQREDGEKPAQKGDDVLFTTDPGGILDLTEAPGAIQATGTVVLATGPGGTIDMRGNPPGTQVVTCPGPIELASDDILTDPGVVPEMLCGPGPVLLGPSREVVLAGVHTMGGDECYPGLPAALEFQVINLGSADHEFEIQVEDSLGWPLMYDVPLCFLSALAPYDTTLGISIDPPPWAIPDVDTNSVRVRARRSDLPEPWYEERMEIPVRDPDELRDVTSVPWQTASPAPGQPAQAYWWLMNIGTLDDDYEVTVDDSLGWGFAPPVTAFPLAATYDTVLCTEAIVPPMVPMGTVDAIYLQIRSLASPMEVVEFDTVRIEVGSVTGVGPGSDTPSAGPGALRHGCRPNPFNPAVEIWLEMPAPGGTARVEIFDARGRRVRSLVLPDCRPGRASCRWDGRDESGAEVASGTYLYRVRAAGMVAAGKLALSR